jgi:hypothetical protein
MFITTGLTVINAVLYFTNSKIQRSKERNNFGMSFVLIVNISIILLYQLKTGDINVNTGCIVSSIGACITSFVMLLSTPNKINKGAIQ